METFQEVAESQGKKEDNKDASDTAGLLEKLNVGDGKTEGKEQEEKPDVAKEEDKQTYKEDKKAVGIFEQFINIGVFPLVWGMQLYLRSLLKFLVIYGCG